MPLSNEAKYESIGNFWDNSPIGRCCRSLKTECIPNTGYQEFSEVKQRISNYMRGYYSRLIPHSYKDELTPNKSEKRC